MQVAILLQQKTRGLPRTETLVKPDVMSPVSLYTEIT